MGGRRAQGGLPPGRNLTQFPGLGEAGDGDRGRGQQIVHCSHMDPITEEAERLKAEFEARKV